MNLTNLVNLTPHTIRIDVEDVIIEIPPSGHVARVEVSSYPVGRGLLEIAPNGARLSVPLVRTSYGRVEGIPPGPGPFLVSAMVLARCAGYTNMFAPDTATGVRRDENGQIFAVTRLVAAPIIEN